MDRPVANQEPKADKRMVTIFSRVLLCERHVGIDRFAPRRIPAEHRLDLVPVRVALVLRFVREISIAGSRAVACSQWCVARGQSSEQFRSVVGRRAPAAAGQFYGAEHVVLDTPCWLDFAEDVRRAD